MHWLADIATFTLGMHDGDEVLGAEGWMPCSKQNFPASISDLHTGLADMNADRLAHGC